MDGFDLDTVLSGASGVERVVAVEPDLDSGVMQVLVRAEGARSTSVQTHPFAPWLLSRQERRFDGAITRRLGGDGYCWRIDFERSGWAGYRQARYSLADEHVGLATYASPVKQFLIASGITLFKKMAFDDLRRTQLDIETTTLSPDAPEARVILASLANSDGDGIVLDSADEALLLEQLARRICDWDPDVIEGHNIFGFDLPYLMARFAAHGMPCVLGRSPDRPVERLRERNCSIGANSRPFIPHTVYGRQVIDTLLQVQRFDSTRGQISSYGLKECAQVYKIASPDRVILDRSSIADQYRDDPERVGKYALQDVEEVRALSEMVLPTDFYQTQMAPDTLQNVAVGGNGEKLNSLLVREYLRRDEAIPLQGASKEYPGGYTEVRRTGVIKPVVKADVESLYPSIMLGRGICPKTDRLSIFLPLLQELTRRRIEAKTIARRAASGSRDYEYWDGLQNSYKILINSFYGYLGGPFYFNDFDAARAVTEAGREIVLSIADRLEATGSLVVEIDTDGVYFRPPPGVAREAQQISYVEEIGAALPEGIRLAHDGGYAAMLSLKIKNYVLVKADGRAIFKGSSLRSRSDEPFGRRFIAEAVALLIAERNDELGALYRATLGRIESGGVPIDDLVRRERVTAKMLVGAQKSRADALKAAGASVGDIVLLYRRADKSMALRDEYAGDEDRDYYADKLHKFAGRLREAFAGDDDFGSVFPAPVPAARRLQMQNQPSFDF